MVPRASRNGGVWPLAVRIARNLKPARSAAMPPDGRRRLFGFRPLLTLCAIRRTPTKLRRSHEHCFSTDPELEVHRAATLSVAQTLESASVVSAWRRKPECTGPVRKILRHCPRRPEACANGWAGPCYPFRSDFSFITLRTSLPKARSFSRRSARLAELKASSACNLRHRARRAGSS